MASDGNGHVALFVTGAEGPVPAQTLNPTYPDDCEQRVDRLPVHCGARRVNDLAGRGEARQLWVPPSDSFVDMAVRGFFAYDWTDGYRTSSYIAAYERQAIPERPLTIAELPEDLAAAAHAVRFTAISFSEADRINPSAYMLCRSSSR